MTGRNPVKAHPANSISQNLNRRPGEVSPYTRALAIYALDEFFAARPIPESTTLSELLRIAHDGKHISLPGETFTMFRRAVTGDVRIKAQEKGRVVILDEKKVQNVEDRGTPQQKRSPVTPRDEDPPLSPAALENMLKKIRRDPDVKSMIKEAALHRSSPRRGGRGSSQKTFFGETKPKKSVQGKSSSRR
jgi:hypothetical protein